MAGSILSGGFLEEADRILATEASLSAKRAELEEQLRRLDVTAKGVKAERQDITNRLSAELAAAGEITRAVFGMLVSEELWGSTANFTSTSVPSVHRILQSAAQASSEAEEFDSFLRQQTSPVPMLLVNTHTEKMPSLPETSKPGWLRIYTRARVGLTIQGNGLNIKYEHGFQPSTGLTSRAMGVVVPLTNVMSTVSMLDVGLNYKRLGLAVPKEVPDCHSTVMERENGTIKRGRFVYGDTMFNPTTHPDFCTFVGREVILNWIKTEREHETPVDPHVLELIEARIA